ncbi:MAG: alpha-glucan family phosphorylase [Bacteroidales bacterium]|nr:alpha-glucan family phosphorylase [Bacteroidales bacterium]
MKADYIFETSWEICNKVGGIHTVLATKAKSLKDRLNDHFILIGPDVWREQKNDEFIEDKNLFSEWKKNLGDNKIKVRTGFWNIPSKPIVILVDFTPYFNYKNEIFAHFWESYKLDSLSGGWDYVEPAMFGYSAGMLIKDFVRFYQLKKSKVIAHFHEWMTGAGILFLKEYAPYISTAFTTHATALGRSIAGNGWPLYTNQSQYQGKEIAKQFNISAKFSLEKLSGQHADVYTTVSDITAKESENLLGTKVDIVTPNGFDEFLIPKDETWEERKQSAKNILYKAAKVVTGQEPQDDDLKIVTSGRYEYKNKGIDLFLDALMLLEKEDNLNRNVFAFIMVPAGIYGPINGIFDAIHNGLPYHMEQEFLTHQLLDPQHDPIIRKLDEYRFSNFKSKKVKIVFVPSYLNGNDGVFNLKYYDLLSAFDLSVFASYYEPWGYTPLESLAFNVPTVTTSLAGFGKWVQQSHYSETNAVKVINRTDDNDNDIVNAISKYVLNYSQLGQADVKENRINAEKVSQTALWTNLIDYYLKAYDIALDHQSKRFNPDDIYELAEVKVEENIEMNLEPNWRSFEVESNVYEDFSGLFEMADNLWWSWNFHHTDIFKDIDKNLWIEVNYNPKKFLNSLPYSTFEKLAKDKVFVEKYHQLVNTFNAYLDEKKNAKGPQIAYFSMEFGFHDALKIFSGGLGILAGDYLKEASDSNVNMVGVGLLYKYGYFKQAITNNGEQLSKYEAQLLSEMPISKVKNEEGDQVIISVNLPGRELKIKLWKTHVGRIILYLLDTDFEDNLAEDREITHYLYGGNNENRLKQEIVLGIGGITALRAIKIDADLYHLNEGHAAFIGLERINKLMYESYFTYQQAVELVRSTSLFTTHTPVPAGHDVFEENLMRRYLSYYHESYGISWDEFFALGKAEKTDFKFSMSNLATHLSQEVNGVSWLHGEVTKEMFNNLWKGYFKQELPVGYVTNGVHFPTWTSKYWKSLYAKVSNNQLIDHQDHQELWDKIYDIDDAKIWDTRNKHRIKLIEYLKERVRENWIQRYDNPKTMVDIINKLDSNVLTIGFARRFATYKRAALLFSDIERLSKIVNNPKQPVQFVFAGKAHPNDKPGQDLIKQIVLISKQPEFVGKILFVENYDMELARKLVQGVDIWLNTPTRPLEASGTSGMKAVMNGGLHFSVLDGWWMEGYQEKAGWALSEEKSFQDQGMQNQLDSSTIYYLLENEIIPKYYKRNKEDVPVEWVSFIKNSISKVASQFTTKRMMNDYYERFYNKLYKRSTALKDNQFEALKMLVEWKNTIAERFEQIKVLKICSTTNDQKILKAGVDTHIEVVLDLNDVKPEEIGLQVVITYPFIEDNDNVEIVNFNVYKKDESKITFRAKIKPNEVGRINYGIRMFPVCDSLEYQQDSGVLKWL